MTLHTKSLQGPHMHKQVFALLATVASATCVAGMALTTSSAIVPAVAADEQANMTIAAFADHAEDKRFDGHEEFIRAAGTVEFDSRVIQWDASDFTADVTVPYGAHFVIRGDALNDAGLYDCSAISGTMVASGHAYAYVPCDPKNIFEFAHHLWISFLTHEDL